MALREIECSLSYVGGGVGAGTFESRKRRTEVDAYERLH